MRRPFDPFCGRGTLVAVGNDDAVGSLLLVPSRHVATLHDELGALSASKLFANSYNQGRYGFWNGTVAHLAIAFEAIPRRDANDDAPRDPSEASEVQGVGPKRSGVVKMNTIDECAIRKKPHAAEILREDLAES